MNNDFYMMCNNPIRALYLMTYFEALPYMPFLEDLPQGKHERKRLKQLEMRAARSIGY